MTRQAGFLHMRIAMIKLAAVLGTMTICPLAVGQAPTASLAVAPVDNPIDMLVQSLSLSHGFWLNGYRRPPLNLQLTAEPIDLVRLIFQRNKTRSGPVTNYSVVEVRQVHIEASFPIEDQVAVSVRSNFGPLVALLHFDDSLHGWDYRVYTLRDGEYQRVI